MKNIIIAQSLYLIDKYFQFIIMNKKKAERMCGLRRPLLLICFSQAFGILLGYYSGIDLHIPCLASAAAFVFLSRKKESFALSVYSLMLIAFLAGFILVSNGEKYVYKTGQSVECFTGTVTKFAVKENYSALTLKCKGEKVLVRFAVTDDSRLYDIVGRIVTVSGKTYAPDPRRNPGCFDYRLYLKGQRIYKICSVSRYRLEAGEISSHFLHTISVLKGKFFGLASEYMGDEEFAVMAGLLFGEKGFIDDELYGEFRENGISHILAVSGLHVGLVYAIVLKLMNGRRNIASGALTCVVIIFYAAISGFSVSVLRASVMIFLNLLAFHLRRRYDLVCAASLTAILFMCINPYCIFDSGFQLSFTAAYSIGVAMPWAQLKIAELSDRFKSEQLYKIGNIFAPCMAVQLGMAPLIMFHFTNFSLVSLILNPAAVALASLILPVGLAMFGISLSGIKIPMIAAAGIENALCRILTWLSGKGGMLGLSWSCTAPSIITLSIYYCFFYFFFSESRYIFNRRCQQKTLACIWAAILSLSMLMPYALGISSSPFPWDHGVAHVNFIDVGQGDCIHIHNGSTDILIDGGGKYNSNIAENTLKPYLLKNGINDIDIAFITHMDGDHCRGIEQLDEIFNVKRIVYPGELKSGDRIQLEDDVFFNVLWPLESYDDTDNNSSLVMMLNIKGARILLTGDVEFEAENRIMEMGPDIDCDVLKISHHGSRGASSDGFMSAANPAFAVISCGKNNVYGHPSSRVIELLENSDIIYGRTDGDGAISITEIRDGELTLQNASREKEWHIRIR